MNSPTVGIHRHGGDGSGMATEMLQTATSLHTGVTLVIHKLAVFNDVTHKLAVFNDVLHKQTFLMTSFINWRF